jgi:hypothetical protein
MGSNDFTDHPDHAKLQNPPLRIHRREHTLVQWPTFISYTITIISSKYQTSFLGCDTTMSGRSLLMFQRNIQPQLQIWWVCWAGKQAGSSSHSVCCLLSWFFDTEDGGSMLLQNVSKLLLHQACHIPGDSVLHSNYCEIPKSHILENI